MSLEAAIAELTEAVKENTAAHAKLAEVATSAASGKAAGSGGSKTTSSKSSSTKAKDDAPAEEKQETAKTTEKKEPELKSKVTAAALKKAAATYLEGDDEDERDAKKQNFIGALSHLGAAKLGEVKTNEDRARLAAYLAYWQAGLEVDFEEIDAKLSGDDEDGDEGGDADDILG